MFCYCFLIAWRMLSMKAKDQSHGTQVLKVGVLCLKNLGSLCLLLSNILNIWIHVFPLLIVTLVIQTYTSLINIYDKYFGGFVFFICHGVTVHVGVCVHFVIYFGATLYFLLFTCISYYSSLEELLKHIL